ncbi:MAG TPA: hypothetical protein DCW97_04060 [Acidobacteria bacterium]|nr:hypothetical protein [Acidobacteriota bacterium]
MPERSQNNGRFCQILLTALLILSVNPVKNLEGRGLVNFDPDYEKARQNMVNIRSRAGGLKIKMS